MVSAKTKLNELSAHCQLLGLRRLRSIVYACLAQHSEIKVGYDAFIERNNWINARIQWSTKVSIAVEPHQDRISLS